MIRKATSGYPLLFEVAVFAALACLLIRGALPTGDSPNFSVEPMTGIQIFLGEGFPEPGLRQFSDGMTVGGVIELTGIGGEVPTLRGDPLSERRLYAGAVLDVTEDPSENKGLSLSWLPARQRLALGIPLHPDRMSREDWTSLPGIGEKLADQIERDRQYYGDFGGLAALERVKGIGPGKLKALRPFFVGADN